MKCHFWLKIIIHMGPWFTWQLWHENLPDGFGLNLFVTEDTQPTDIQVWWTVMNSCTNGCQTNPFDKSVWVNLVLYGTFKWWRHQMETFSASLALCAGNSPVTGEFPHKGQWRGAFDVFFDLRLNKPLSKHRLMIYVLTVVISINKSAKNVFIQASLPHVLFALHALHTRLEKHFIVKNLRPRSQCG